jgi:hypothetical protein
MKTPKPQRKLFKRMNALFCKSPAFRQHVATIIAQHTVYYNWQKVIGSLPPKPPGLVAGGVICIAEPAELILKQDAIEAMAKRFDEQITITLGQANNASG